MNPILKTIKEGEEESIESLKSYHLIPSPHPHQEDEEIASTILTLNTIATLRALIAEEEGRLKNRWGYSKEFREANSGYMVGIREHNEALKESIQLKEDIIKELEK